MHLVTAGFSLVALLVLWAGRNYAGKLFENMGMSNFFGQTLARAIPVVLRVVGIMATAFYFPCWQGLKQSGKSPRACQVWVCLSFH